MYIVKTGALVVHKADKEKSQERPAVVARCSVGDVFGERALLKNEPRAATVTCVNDSVLLRLDRSAFKLLLGPLEDIISQRIAEDYDATLQVPLSAICCLLSVVCCLLSAVCYLLSAVCCLLSVVCCLLGSFEDIISQRIAKDYDAILQDEDGAGAVRDVGVELSDVMITDDCARPVIPMARLQVLGTLGKGSFGFVQLVKDRETGTTYALKAVSKAQIVETGQQAHILSEKNVMLQLDSPFLVKLWQTYQDRDRLYFLLEPSLGGELFSVLREQERFPDTTAMFYAASVVVAFEYMHGKNFVYRDLKPENLLLDERGYLKVTDFGFAKDISRGRTFTLCGTPDYLAPEIVAGKGHGKGVDWWCLGVFMFEMLTSTAPFCADSPMKTYKKILAGVVMYPPYVSPAAQDLMQQLLHAKATKRLGVVRGGASLIKQHRWFQDAKFSFHHLVAFKLSAPYIPTIKDETDVSNFDDYPEGEDPVTPYQDDGSAWAADF
jgi:protein kinase A